MSTVITKEVFRYLSNHVWELQDKKIKIASAFAMDFNAYINLLDFINLYIRRIDNYLDTVKIGIGQHELPFAILGSIVHVLDKDNGAITKYTVMLPDKEPSKEDRYNNVKSESCFSDIGKSLLYKKVKEEVLIETNGSEMIGKIEKIEFEMIL